MHYFTMGNTLYDIRLGAVSLLTGNVRLLNIPGRRFYHNFNFQMRKVKVSNQQKERNLKEKSEDGEKFEGEIRRRLI